VLWEAVALKLAAAAGVNVPAWRVELVADRQVLLLRRFDRDGALRIPFLSAMSMLGSSDRETHSYLEIADAIRQYGAAPVEDLKQLWRRMVFTILISNTDDHLRNHAFLYQGNDGWRLSPAYDVNPVPADLKPRVLSTFIDADDGTASLELALSVAGYFTLDPARARKIAGEAGRAVSRWRQTAARVGLRKAEMDRMASAFDHRDLKDALKG
jgi:serine/threonine-protein kinase HipA